jgi:bifunctional non-homologous end joining protein LigD
LAKSRGEALRYFAFDMLFLGGLDLRSLPLIERKEALRAIITAPGIVRFSEHFLEDGPTFFAMRACSASKAWSPSGAMLPTALDAQTNG